MLKDIIPKDPNFLAMAIGLALLLGWAAGLLCRKVKVPMVVGYIVVGIVLGQSLLGVFNSKNLTGLYFIIYIGLACIGFDIGGELALSKIRKLGKPIIWISVLETVAAFVLVTTAIYLYTKKLYLALIFGALASATAPAATVAVLREYQASGPLTTTTFAVVGIDDAYAVMIYAFASFLAKVLISNKGVHVAEAVLRPIGEILAALGIGLVIGLVFLFLVRHYTAKRGLMVLTWGVIIVTTGLANWLNLSLILANMALGLTVVNLTKWKREDVFELLRSTTPPLFVVFFVLVGAELQAGKLLSVGIVGLLYVVFRSVGKFSGAYLGGVISDAPPAVRKYTGLCLFPQGGVAIGLALQTMITFGGGKYGHAGTELGVLAVSMIAATCLFLEIIGPPCTRYAVIKAGEANI